MLIITFFLVLCILQKRFAAVLEEKKVLSITLEQGTSLALGTPNY